MRDKNTARVLLSAEAWKTILLDAYGRQGIEACGALLGKRDEAGNWWVEVAQPLRNTSMSPVYFEFDPAELLMVELEQPDRMVGVYHSHPTGPARASATDRGNMQRVNQEQQIPWVWLIVSGPFTAQPDEDATVATERATISAKGLIAYYHDPQAGLQQVVIQRDENKDGRLPDAPRERS